MDRRRYPWKRKNITITGKNKRRGTPILGEVEPTTATEIGIIDQKGNKKFLEIFYFASPGTAEKAVPTSPKER